MRLKKETFLIPSLITLIMSFPSPGFAQDAPNVATLRQLLDSIEGEDYEKLAEVISRLYSLLPQEEKDTKEMRYFGVTGFS